MYFVSKLCFFSCMEKSAIGLCTIIGGARPPPPYGSRFFRFDMQNFRNVAASGVHGPPYEIHAPPPTGNPGSATDNVYFCTSAQQIDTIIIQAEATAKGAECTYTDIIHFRNRGRGRKKGRGHTDTLYNNKILTMFCNSGGFLSVKDAFSETGYPAFYR